MAMTTHPLYIDAVDMPLERSLTRLAKGIFPGLTARLLRLENGWETLADYRRVGGYDQTIFGSELIEAVLASGLRGRGGAAFPAGIKFRTLAQASGQKVVVANGEEGEPASVKDRWLLRNRPHLIIDGLLIAATVIGARRAYVYMSDRQAKNSVERALAQIDTGDIAIQALLVERSYVAGEETSVVRAIDGGPAKPTDKPPRPFEAGVGKFPTLISNVETLANLPFIARHGWQAFREVGCDAASPGSFLMTITGAVARPGLYELPLGVRLVDALNVLARPIGLPRGFVMGGFFGGILGPTAVDARLTYDTLRELKSSLGCGAVVVLGENDSPLWAAADIMAFFVAENAKQCGACVRGTAAMSRTLSGIAAGQAQAIDVEKLRGWSTSLIGRGACATLDGAAYLSASVLREFPDDVAASLSGVTDPPQGISSTTRFSIDINRIPS